MINGEGERGREEGGGGFRMSLGDFLCHPGFWEREKNSKHILDLSVTVSESNSLLKTMKRAKT
jgi:hypothetical protein